MLSCNRTPYVLDEFGEAVPSKMFQVIFDHVGDREKTKQLYYAMKTPSFLKWFGYSEYVDEYGEPDLYVDEQGRLLVTNDKDEDRAVFNNKQGKKQPYTKESIIQDLRNQNIINLIRFRNRYLLPRGKEASDLANNYYRKRHTPDTLTALAKIKDYNERFRRIHNVNEDVLLTKPFGVSVELTINEGLIDQVNEQEEHELILSPRVRSSINPTITVGVNNQNEFDNFLAHKENLVKRLENRLVDINNKINNIAKDPNAATNIHELHKIKDLINLRLNGNSTRTGLYSEMIEIKRAKEIYNLDEIAKRDLERADMLANSDNYEDIDESIEIVNFYLASLPNDKRTHPIFRKDELFLNGVSLLTDFELEIMTDWFKEANRISSRLNDNLKKKVLETLNSNSAVQSTLGTISEKDITEAMKDTALVDKWIMDATNGIVRSNSILPQIAKMAFEDAMNRALSTSIEFEERLAKVLPEAEKQIIEIDNGKYKLAKYLGFITSKGFKLKNTGVSWDLFFQRDITGLRTKNLVSRYTKKWEDEEKQMRLEKDEKMFKIMNDPAKTSNEKYVALVTNRREKLHWYSTNSIILNITTVPELRDFVMNTTGFEFLRPFMTSNDTSVISITGNHLNEAVKKQKELLWYFKFQYDSMVKEFLDEEGVANISLLQPDSQAEIETWFHSNNPVNALNGSLDNPKPAQILRGGKMVDVWADTKYVVKIPRSYTRLKNGIMGEATHYYDENFKIIDSSNALYEFHQVASDILRFKKSVLPATDQKDIGDLEIGIMQKSLAELIFDKDVTNAQKLVKGGRMLYDKIRTLGWIYESSPIDSSSPDLVNQLPRKTIVKGLLTEHSKEIDYIFDIERANFLIVYNDANSIPLNKLTKSTVISETNFKDHRLISQLADMLGVPPTIKDIKTAMNIFNKPKGTFDKNGNPEFDPAQIPVGRILYTNATDQVVKDSSYNLPKMLITFSQLAANYQARTQIKPLVETINNLYKDIDAPAEQNTGLTKYFKRTGTAMKSGKRDNAIKQIEDWERRVLLGSSLPSGGHLGVSKRKYTKEEKEKINEINDKLMLLANDMTPAAMKIKADLNNDLQLLGHNLSASQVVTDILTIVRNLNLGWSIKSAFTNFCEGQIANEISMAIEQHYPNERWYEATRVVRLSRKKAFKTAVGVKTSNVYANFMTTMMNRFNVLQDSRNEFQKADIKTSYSLTAKLDPMLLNQSVEYLNQAPLLTIAMMNEKIFDISGNESTVFDAFDMKTAKLKPEFRTPENISNWERGVGSEYSAFKSHLMKAIVNTHGDYEKFRGNLAKSTVAGKVMLMYKGWLPRAVYNRIAPEQIDLEIGKKHKGRYRSHNTSTAALHAGIAGLILGPIGGVAGLAIGAGLGRAFGNQPDLNILKQTLITLELLTRKMIGIPVNRFSHKNIINTGSLDELKARGMVSGDFTELDAKNMLGNLTEMAIQLLQLGFALIVKLALYDEDDDPNSIKRIAHNVLINLTMGLFKQAIMYIDPIEMWQGNVGRVPLLMLIQNGIDLVDAAIDLINGRDTDTSTGPNRGKSKTVEATSKFLPVPLRPKFGLQNLMLYPRGLDNNWEKMFWTDYKKAEADINRKRTNYQEQLEASGKYTSTEIKSIMENTYPTLDSQLKKGKAIFGIEQEDIPKLKRQKLKKKYVKEQRIMEEDIRIKRERLKNKR